MIKAETCYGVIRIGEEWINSVLNFDEFGRPVVTMFYSILHEPSKLVLGRFNGIGNVTFYKNRYFSSEAGSGAGITKFYSAMLVQGAYSQENQLSFNACSIDISPYFLGLTNLVHCLLIGQNCSILRISKFLHSKLRKLNVRLRSARILNFQRKRVLKIFIMKLRHIYFLKVMNNWV